MTPRALLLAGLVAVTALASTGAPTAAADKAEAAPQPARARLEAARHTYRLAAAHAVESSLAVRFGGSTSPARRSKDVVSLGIAPLRGADRLDEGLH